MSSSDDKIDYLSQEELDSIEEEYAFETNFYKTIAGTDNFEVIPLPCLDGSVLTTEEKQALAAHARNEGKKLLFRVSLGNIAITFGEDSEKIGISPEFNAHGFPC